MLFSMVTATTYTSSFSNSVSFCCAVSQLMRTWNPLREFQTRNPSVSQLGYSQQGVFHKERKQQREKAKKKTTQPRCDTCLKQTFILFWNEVCVVCTASSKPDLQQKEGETELCTAMLQFSMSVRTTITRQWFRQAELRDDISQDDTVDLARL